MEDKLGTWLGGARTASSHHPQYIDAVYEKTHKKPGPTPIFTSLRLFHLTTPAPPHWDQQST